MLNVWQPYTDLFGDHSVMQTWLQNYDNGGLQCIEAGWNVDPSTYWQDWPYFSNSAPHLFVFYTNNGYGRGSGYNQDTYGWVQVDPNIFPGAQLVNVLSSFDGAQTTLDIGFELFEGNWWLSVYGTWIGYYPGTLFLISPDPAVTAGPFVQLNDGGVTNGPAAAGDPLASTVWQQWHVVYTDAVGIVWDCWYDGPFNAWRLQQINGGAGGMTDGPACVGNPMATEFSGQFNVVYRDAAGLVWDSWYNGAWNLQQINGPAGITTGALSAADPRAYVLADQLHILYRDAGGLIWDSWLDGPTNAWNLQQLNGAGGVVPTAPAAAGQPTAIPTPYNTQASTQDNQWHVIYRDGGG